MVFGRIRDAVLGPPDLDGPSVLPDYFPVEPAGCERHSQKLFACLASDATAKAREMEKAGLHKSYYPDVTPKPDDERAAAKAKEAAAERQEGTTSESVASSDDRLPTANDNPLDECRSFIALYKRCCDRELKKKKNWMLTETYRVQEEYRMYGGEKETHEFAGGAGAGAEASS